MPFKFGVDSSGNYGYIKDGADTVTPFLTRTGNATETNVLSGKTFSNANSSGLTGTMTNNGGATKSATYSLDSTNSRVVATIPNNGYYSTSSKLYATYANVRSLIGLTAAKIVKGNTILGLAGTAIKSPTSLSGSVSCGKLQAGDGVKSFQVTFSTAFGSIPTVQINSTGDDHEPKNLKVTNVTKAGFTFTIEAGGPTGEWETLTVTWNAVI